jgi:methanogenic corrinoid protein MtbC1
VEEAIRFARACRLPVKKPELLGLSEVSAAPARNAEADGTEFRDALVAGNAEAVRGSILSRYLAGGSIAEIADELVAPALHHIGEQWRHGIDGIYVEHRATDLCIQAFQHLRALLPDPGEDAPLAVGGSPTHDVYMLPSLMAATVAAGEGWRATNLGPETPLEVLAEAAAKADARVVWLAMSVEQSAKEVEPGIRQLAERLGWAGRSLVIGGCGWPKASRPVIENVHIGASMRELAAFLHGMSRGEGSVPAEASSRSEAGSGSSNGRRPVRAERKNKSHADG